MRLHRNDGETNTNMKTIKEDEEFEKKWYEYHQQNAKLRILCSKCNQEREKPNYKSDDEIL